MANKIKYSQVSAEANSDTFTTKYYKLETTDTVRETKTINSVWGDNSGLYCGTNGNSLIGSYTYLEFPDFSEGDFDKFNLDIGTATGQINLRFGVVWGFSPYRYGFKWTGIEESVANSYNRLPAQPTSGTSVTTGTITFANPFTQAYQDVNMTGVQSSPYFVTFPQELKINDLIFVPHFVIKTVTITSTDATNNIVKISAVSDTFTWAQIKPEDKTPAGEYYETYKNLYTNTYEVVSTQQDSKVIRFCAGVLLTPYYGKSSHAYDSATDSYSQATSAFERYNARQVLGSTNPDDGEYPANATTPYLSIFYEQNIPELKGVYYGTPAGIRFTHGATQNNLETDSFNINTTFAPTADYSKLSTGNVSWNPISNYSQNVTATAIFSNINPDDDTPLLVFPSTLMTSKSGKISDYVSVITTSGNKLFEDGLGDLSQCTRNRAFVPSRYFSGFQIADLWSTIMSFGCYVADAPEHAQIAPLGANLNGNPHIYCGNMDGNFVTDGTAKQGDDIQDLPQTKIDDIIQGTPYKPLDPSGGGSDPDSDKQVAPNKIEGVTMPLQTGRTLGSGLGFITMYNLDSMQLQALGSALWHSVADYDPSSIDPQTGNIVHNFYVQLGQEVTGTFDTSAILDYFVSLKQYPFSVGTLPVTTAFGSNVYIGNGKVGIPIGSGVRVLTSSIGMLSAGSCLVRPVTPYNDFRDYYNSTVTVYLPYCGTVELNPTEVINQTLTCYYAIDFYTGDCTAYLTVDGNPSYIIGVANGTIGVDIPLSATADAQLQARHLIDGAQTARIFRSMITAGRAAIDGDIAGAVSGVLDIQSAGMQLDATQKSRSGVASGFLSGGAGGASFYAPDSAFVIIRRGTYKRPDNYPSTVAYPSTQSGKLGAFAGYTECINVNMTGVTATTTEKDMIYDLLQSGVII